MNYCRYSLLALVMTLSVATAARAQPNLDKLQSANFRAALKKAIDNQKKKPASPLFKAADAVFQLDDAGLARIEYDPKAHKLTWRCPPKPGVAKVDAEPALKPLEGFS